MPESPVHEPEYCRECRDEREWLAPGVPADFILWGKLLPSEAFGPRCTDHAVTWLPHLLEQPDQYAVFDLRPYRQMRTDRDRLAEQVQRVRAVQADMADAAKWCDTNAVNHTAGVGYVLATTRDLLHAALDETEADQ